MKIANKWLNDFIETRLKPKQISEYLTDIGLEVEGIENFETIKGGLKGLIVGEIIDVKRHPNADKLNITRVNIGNETLKIVCGASNVENGQKVVVATVGTEIFHKNGESLKIKKAKIRGEDSFGMICAEDEIGLSDNHDGILVLDKDSKIGSSVSDIFHAYYDEVYEIGLTPNRTDAMSHYGVARDLNAFLVSKKIKSNFKPFQTPKIEFDKSTACPIQVEIEDDNLCPLYSGVYLKNISVKESPDWIKNKLKSIGIEPINNVVDITNYCLHHLGQPLHAFDADKIKDHKIIIGNPKTNKLFLSLDKIERKLYDNDLMIKDGKHNPLCIAGVFGGLDSGISESTTNIFLESAYFDPVAVRKSAKNHALNTDASFRFERGVDYNNVLNALMFATDLLIKYADAKIEGNFVFENPKKIKKNKVNLRYHQIDKVLGKRLHHDKIKEILELLEFEILSFNSDYLELEVPSFRLDVTREIDIIEELLRIYGYNSIDIPDKITFSYNKSNDKLNIENKIADYLIFNGYNEIMTNSLIQDKETPDKVLIINPLSKDLSMMRNNMIPSLLQTIAFNLNRKQLNIKIFEFGKTYQKNENKFIENNKLCIAISGDIYKNNWMVKNSTSNFYHLKGVVFNILKSLNLNDISESSSKNSDFSESILLKYKKRRIAEIGIISNNLLNEFGISQDVYFADIDLDFITNHQKENNFKVNEIPKFPGSKRDLALLLDEDVKYVSLYKAAKKISPIIKYVYLFDVYNGKNIPKGKKSYAISFYLQDDSKTLTDKEIDTIMNKLIKLFKKEFKAELR